MSNKNVIIRLVHACEIEQSLSPEVGRVTGLINAENFAKLMDVLSIASNPRKPKETSITTDIQQTLVDHPEHFHLMTKGMLVSASRCESLERNRYRLDFNDNVYAEPGLLDGGHNTFAIAKFLLSYALDESDLKKIKDWDHLVVVWAENKHKLEDLFANTQNTNESLTFEFLIPVEIIYPRHPENDDMLQEWGESHRNITHARNNNVQLNESTKDHHQGFYDYLKMVIDPDVAKRIEWKTNEGGPIKVADLTALSLIALSKLPQDLLGSEVSVVKIYNSKQYCVETFRQILEKGDANEWQGQKFVLNDNRIKSALDLVQKIIEAYDAAYILFPAAYNLAGGSFGSIKGIRNKKGHTKYTNQETEYVYADGFIIPIIVAMRELIGIKSDGTLYWTDDPVGFVKKYINNLLQTYYSIIKMASYDPQKIGKAVGSYHLISTSVQMIKQLK